MRPSLDNILSHIIKKNIFFYSIRATFRICKIIYHDLSARIHTHFFNFWMLFYSSRNYSEYFFESESGKREVFRHKKDKKNEFVSFTKKYDPGLLTYPRKITFAQSADLKKNCSNWTADHVGCFSLLYLKSVL